VVRLDELGAPAGSLVKGIDDAPLAAYNR